MISSLDLRYQRVGANVSYEDMIAKLLESAGLTGVALGSSGPLLGASTAPERNLLMTSDMRRALTGQLAMLTALVAEVRGDAPETMAMIEERLAAIEFMVAVDGINTKVESLARNRNVVALAQEIVKAELARTAAPLTEDDVFDPRNYRVAVGP